MPFCSIQINAKWLFSFSPKIFLFLTGLLLLVNRKCIWRRCCAPSHSTLEKEIPRGRIGLNYLSKFVCTQWAVWLVYSSSWIVVGWKFYCLTNSNALSVYTNLCTVLTSDKKSILLICLIIQQTKCKLLLFYHVSILEYEYYYCIIFWFGFDV